ncbi:MAG: hypothetical protein O2963_03640, partial [Proteobacteria bacterium]|nr:hypothetical protein [Pseudomonadota bacterium]
NLKTEAGDVRSNSDPITGQAAWFDTQIKIEKISGAFVEETLPMFDAYKPHEKFPRPDVIRYGFEKEITFYDHERSLGTNKKGDK